MAQSFVEVHQSLLQDVASGTGIIAPFCQHKGGDRTARVEVAGCFSIPDFSKSFAIDVLVAYDLAHAKGAADLLSLLETMASLDVEHSFQGKTGLAKIENLVAWEPDFRQIMRAMVRAKREYLRLREELQKVIGLSGKVDFVNLFQRAISTFVDSFSVILGQARIWKDNNFNYKYYYIVAGEKGLSDYKLPSNIIVNLNDVERIRYQINRFEPFCNTNTGLRIKMQFIYIVSHIMNMPWGFPGIWEWMDLIEHVDVSKLADPTLSGPEQATHWLNTILQILLKSKETILTQPDLSVIKAAEILCFQVIRVAAIISMEHKAWAEGPRESSLKLEWQHFKSEIYYMMTAEPDALPAWQTWVSRATSLTGFPIEEGDASWRAFPKFGGSLQFYEVSGCKDADIFEDEVFDDIILSVGVTKNPYMMIKDDKASFYPRHSTKLYRDGTLVISAYNEAGVFLIDQVDDFIAITLRQVDFENPDIKISINGVDNQWAAVLNSIGLKEVYAGVALKYKYKGRVLPWASTTVLKAYGFPKQTGLSKVMKSMDDYLMKLAMPAGEGV